MKFHKEAVCFHSNHCDKCTAMVTLNNESDGDLSSPPSSDEWRGGESEEGGQRTHTEAFVQLMEESNFFSPLQKYALWNFAIYNADQANTLFQAAYQTAIHMGDLDLFSQGIETIADILMGVGIEKDCPLDANDQAMVTIVGLVSLINSAQELLESKDISNIEYATLLAATFSRHPSMEMCFDMFQSSMYHSLVVMGTKEKTKIGKSIIFHCIRNLTPFKAQLLRHGHAVGDGRSSVTWRDCKVEGKGVKGWARVSYCDTSAVMEDIPNATNGIGANTGYYRQLNDVEFEQGLGGAERLLREETGRMKEGRSVKGTCASDILILIDEFLKNFTYNDLKASLKQRSRGQLFLPSNQQAGCRVLSTPMPCKSKQGAMGYRLWPRAAVCLIVLFCLGVESRSTDGAPFTNNSSSIEVADGMTDDEGFKTRELSLFSSSQHENVLSPSDPIKKTGCTVASPGGEESFQAIDGNTNTKYSNLCPSTSNDRGFQVATTTSIITAISMTTAKDYPGRDPKNWKIRGSNDGKTYSDIAQGSFAQTAERFSTQIVPFQNSISYKDYWVTFEPREDTVIQVAEVQLMQAKPYYCDEPKCTQAVWDTIAEGYTCGTRISWVQSNWGYSRSDACSYVTSVFPNTCPCRPSSICSSTMINEGSCPNSLQSASKLCSLIMQDDGNLVIYDRKWQAQWASNTDGRGAGAPYTLKMHDDGNAVVYDRVKNQIWQTGTRLTGTLQFKLEIKDDCNLVVYDKYTEIWDNWKGVRHATLKLSEEPGTCVAVAGVYPPPSMPGNPIHSVQVDGVVNCEIECMKRTDCVAFVLNSITEGGTCKLYNSLSYGRYYHVGGNNIYGGCTKPIMTSNGFSDMYIMNAGVGGYLSSRDINPLIKREGNSWEKWTIVKSSNDGTKYNIKDYRGRYLSAQPSGLVEFRNWESTWERWVIMRVSNDNLIIRGHHGMFLAANGAGWVLANSIKATSWEEWRITNNNDVKGEGPDGEFVLAGVVLLPIVIAVSVVAAPLASPALALTAGSAAAATTAIKVSMVAAVSIGIAGKLTDYSIELIKTGVSFDSKLTRVVTASVAHAALFEACLTEACRKSPCWEDGAVCGPGTTCGNCCNVDSYWPDHRLAQACGRMPCWGSNTRCLGGSTCKSCCNGSRWVWQWLGDHCN